MNFERQTTHWMKHSVWYAKEGIDTKLTRWREGRFVLPRLRAASHWSAPSRTLEWVREAREEETSATEGAFREVKRYFNRENCGYVQIQTISNCIRPVFIYRRFYASRIFNRSIQ